MSEREEYVREYKLYMARLDQMAKALRELDDDWAARFVSSVRRQIDHQDVDAWGPSPKQSAILEDLKRKYGKALFNEAARRELLQKREEFLERLRQLREAARAAGDKWLDGFLDSIDVQIEKRKPLSRKQKDALKKSLVKYKLAHESQYDRRGIK